MSTTGVHNHPPHIKNATGTKMDLTPEAPAANIQGYSQPMTQNMASTSQGMANQHQMCTNMNFASTSGTANNNFSMTNILNHQMTDLDPNSMMNQPNPMNQMDSTMAINSQSVDNMQMQQQMHRNILNMNVDIAITSPNS